MGRREILGSFLGRRDPGQRPRLGEAAELEALGETWQPGTVR